ncbi:tumor protein D54-like isoform X2 [Gigantopelta aegis]|uniref:tumor protein D54-like isoform X2 n=1 Tax=Gigantopelta aegis TaxID=1735272 RepID=UPI001B88817A|nr:tumor protein D54-like isoform X2 [Gigantopelta aegis]
MNVVETKTMGDNSVLMDDQRIGVDDGDDDDDDDVDNYKLVMSDAENYHSYLQLVHTTSVECDEGEEEEDCKMFARENGYEDEAMASLPQQPTGPPNMTPEEALEYENQMLKWREELLKVEQEISTLRQVLGAKVRTATELKRKLGITPFQELKSDLQTGIQQLKSSDSYQKTNEKIHQINDKITHSTVYQKTSAVVKTAGEKTSAALSTFGSSMSKKLGDLRNSQTFKSLEEKVENTYSSVKAKVSGSQSTGNIHETLTEEDGSKTEMGTLSHDPTAPLPEDKVPL